MATNNTTIDRIDTFHKTKKGRVIFGLAELAIAYLFVSLAIDSANLWQYGLAALFTVGGANNLVRAFSGGGVSSNGKKSARKR